MVVTAALLPLPLWTGTSPHHPPIPLQPIHTHAHTQDTAEDREAARRRLAERQEAGRREVEANKVRYEPLGLDRRYNRYWWCGGGEGSEPSAGGQGRVAAQRAIIGMCSVCACGMGDGGGRAYGSAVVREYTHK